MKSAVMPAEVTKSLYEVISIMEILKIVCVIEKAVIEQQLMIKELHKQPGKINEMVIGH